MKPGWDWRIRGFDKAGHFVIETIHRGVGSLSVELLVYEARRRSGEIATIQVTALSAEADLSRDLVSRIVGSTTGFPKSL